MINNDFMGCWQDLQTYSPAVITIGKFDGVHLGHQQLLSKAKQVANTLNIKVRVIFFYPHPVSLFRQEKLIEITTLQERFELLHLYGADEIICLNFNMELANLEACDFLQLILKEKMQAKAVIVGEDFCFGRNKSGDVAMLQNWCDNNDVLSIIVKDILLNGKRISTSWCRDCLANKDTIELSKLLGR